MDLDPKLRTWAISERQQEIFDAVLECGGICAGARKVGIDSAAVSRSIQRLKERAASAGYSPEHDMTRTVPAPFVVRGVSTYYDADGKPRGQWVKSRMDDAQWREHIEATIAALSSDVKGLAPLVEPPRGTKRDLLAIYPLGDPHIGMRAWARECGEDFDLKIARRLTLAAVDRLVQSGPAAETAIILPLGDVFHANDQSNQTPAHRHQLDVDSRYVHVLQVGIEIFRHTILRALERHKRVVVRFVAGNHDPEAIWALAFTIAAYFENEKRVQVDLSPAKHWFYRFGRVLIGATHGDTTKPAQLPGVMACDRAADWGETKHRLWLCGHVHNSSVQEFPGVSVETFRTLAAADAYAAGHGYRAGRDMRLIIMHREHGEVERHRVDVGMLA